MANLKSSQKDIRRISKRTLRNRMAKSQLKSLAKKVREVAAGEDAELRKCSSIAYVSALDKAVKRGIIHKNQANRRKSTVASFIFG